MVPAAVKGVQIWVKNNPYNRTIGERRRNRSCLSPHSSYLLLLRACGKISPALSPLYNKGHIPFSCTDKFIYGAYIISSMFDWNAAQQFSSSVHSLSLQDGLLKHRSAAHTLVAIWKIQNNMEMVHLSDASPCANDACSKLLHNRTFNASKKRAPFLQPFLRNSPQAHPDAGCAILISGI